MRTLIILTIFAALIYLSAGRVAFEEPTPHKATGDAPTTLQEVDGSGHSNDDAPRQARQFLGSYGYPYYGGYGGYGGYYGRPYGYGIGGLGGFGGYGGLGGYGGFYGRPYGYGFGSPYGFYG